MHTATTFMVLLPCTDIKVHLLTVSPSAGWQGCRKAAARAPVKQSPEGMVTCGAPYWRWLHLMNAHGSEKLTRPSLTAPLRAVRPGRFTLGHRIGNPIAHVMLSAPIRCPKHLLPCGRSPPLHPYACYYRDDTQPVRGFRLQYFQAIQALKSIKFLSSYLYQQVLFSVTALLF